MKMKYRALAVLLCTAFFFACLCASSAGFAFTKTRMNPIIKNINPIPTATPVPFPENVTATPLGGKPGKVTPPPYRPTLPPLPDKPIAPPTTKVPTATPGTPLPSKYVSTAPGSMITPKPIIITLHAVPLSSSSIRLTWEGTDETAAGFIVYMARADILQNGFGEFLVGESEPYFTRTELDEGTLYCFRVAFRYERGNDWFPGLMSPLVYCSTLLPAPRRLSIQTSALESILSWEEVAGAQEYVVYRRGSQGSFDELLRVESARATIPTPPNGRSDDYRVSAVNEWGVGDLSSEITVMGSSGLPLRAPAWLHATPTNDARVYTLSWEPVPGANRYYIYTDRNNTGETRIGPVTATQCSTGELLFGSTYECYVRAANEAVYGRNSETVTLEIPPAENPSLGAPDLYSAEALSSSSVKLWWHSVNGAVRYQVYYATGNSLAAEVNATSCTIDELQPSIQYSFKVRAMDANNAAGPFSNTKQVYTKSGYLAPAWKDLRSIGPGYIVLEWDPVHLSYNGFELEPPQGYNVYRKEAGGGTYTKICTVPGQSQLSYFSAVDHNVQPGKRYGYYIRAYHELYGEGYYTPNYIKAALTAPTGLRATVLSPTRIRLEWDDEEIALHYFVTLPDYAYGDVHYIKEVDEPYCVYRRTDYSTDFQNNILSFQVWYWDTEYESSPAAWISVRIKLEAPQGFTARALDSSRVQLSWQRVEGADSYNVYRSETSNGAYDLVGHTTTDMNLEANKVYYYKVAAVNGAGPGDLSAEASTRTGIAVPQNLVAASVSSSKIHLTWNAVPGAEAYDVYRSDTPDGIHGVIRQVTDTSMTDESLLPNTLHSYKVAAFAHDLDGEASAPAVARTRVAAPQGLHAIALDSSSVHLSFLSVEGAESYNVYRSTLQNGKYRLIGQNLTDTGLEADTIYYYRVAGVNGEGPGDLSQAVSVRTGIPAPQNLVAESLSQSKIGLAWNAVPGAEAYDVYRSDTPDGIHGVIKRVTGTSTSDEGLLPNTRHSYKVAAVIEGRVGEASAAAFARTRIAAPKGLNAVAVGSDSIRLAWEPVDGALIYTVYRSFNLEEEFEPVGDDTNSPGFTDTGLKRGATYYYYVKASNKWGEGEKSSQVSARTGQ